jgi:hypothetical protein
LSQYETPEKVTNERASKYDISVAFTLSLSLPPQYANPSKNEPINEHALECG